MFVLDTDHVSLFQRNDPLVSARVLATPSQELATTVRLIGIFGERGQRSHKCGILKDYDPCTANVCHDSSLTNSRVRLDKITVEQETVWLQLTATAPRALTVPPRHPRCIAATSAT